MKHEARYGPMLLGEWINATTPCPTCGGPNAPDRYFDDISGAVTSKGRECRRCFNLRAFARRMRLLLQRLGHPLPGEGIPDPWHFKPS